MQDRVPLYPGRVKLIPVAGQDNVYDMERADQPTQLGTPLNKNTFLKDTTARKYGLGVDATPDDILNNLVSAAVAAKYQLEMGAVPNDLFDILSKAALVSGDSGDLVLPNGNSVRNLKYVNGGYTGTGTSNLTIPTGFTPLFCLIEINTLTSLFASGGSSEANVEDILIWCAGITSAKFGSSVANPQYQTATFTPTSDSFVMKMSGINSSNKAYKYFILGE